MEHLSFFPFMSLANTPNLSSIIQHRSRHVRCHSTDMNTQPHATHNPDHNATHTQATSHQQIDAKVWGSVTNYSRAEHSNKKITMHDEERDTVLKLNEHASIYFQTFDQHRSASDLSIERVLAKLLPTLFVNYAPPNFLYENLDQNTCTAYLVRKAPMLEYLPSCRGSRTVQIRAR